LAGKQGCLPSVKTDFTNLHNSSNLVLGRRQCTYRKIENKGKMWRHDKYAFGKLSVPYFASGSRVLTFGRKTGLFAMREDRFDNFARFIKSRSGQATEYLPQD
jgi:hypothetical protein